MSSSRKKSPLRPAKKTPKKAPSITRDGRIEILFEHLRHEFLAVIEGQQALGDKIDREIGGLRVEMNGRFSVLEAAVRDNSVAIRKNSEDIRQNTEDIRKHSEAIARLEGVVDNLVVAVDGKASAASVAALDQRTAVLEDRINT
jgi:hypothetical protein